MAGEQGFMDSYAGVELEVPTGPIEVETPTRTFCVRPLRLGQAARLMVLLDEAGSTGGQAAYDFLDEFPRAFIAETHLREKRRWFFRRRRTVAVIAPRESTDEEVAFHEYLTGGGATPAEVFTLGRRFLAHHRAAPAPSPVTTTTATSPAGTT